MDRLTMRIEDKVYYSKDGKPILPIEILDTQYMRKALRKLADYEDAGISPEEVKRLAKGKAVYEAYDGSKLDKADQYIEKLEKALHLACADAADDCCPHELYDYETEKCGDCPHDGAIYQDTERDIACWENYYLQEAYNGIMSNR